MLRHEDNKQRRTQIIYPLNIITSWMSYCKRKEHSNQHTLNLLSFKSRQIRMSPYNVNDDLSIVFLIILWWNHQLGIIQIQEIVNAIVIEIAKVVVNYLFVIITFYFELTLFLVDGNCLIFEEDFPCFAPLRWYSLWYAVPNNVSEFFHIDHFIAIQNIIDLHCFLSVLVYANFL